MQATFNLIASHLACLIALYKSSGFSVFLPDYREELYDRRDNGPAANMGQVVNNAPHGFLPCTEERLWLAPQRPAAAALHCQDIQSRR